MHAILWFGATVAFVMNAARIRVPFGDAPSHPFGGTYNCIILCLGAAIVTLGASIGAIFGKAAVTGLIAFVVAAFVVAFFLIQ
jgi:hypothetical protein